MALAALIVGVIGLSIAFAVVTRNLVINGTAEIKGPEWDIRFSTQSSAATGGASITSSQIDDRTISYHVIFTAPSQSAVINFTMANNSSLNAEIANITTVGSSDYAAKHINWNLQYTDGTSLSVGDLLAAGSSRAARLNLDYLATEGQFEADAGSQVSMVITIQYAQSP
jgi:hypothetical protein